MITEQPSSQHNTLPSDLLPQGLVNSQALLTNQELLTPHIHPPTTPPLAIEFNASVPSAWQAMADYRQIDAHGTIHIAAPLLPLGNLQQHINFHQQRLQLNQQWQADHSLALLTQKDADASTQISWNVSHSLTADLDQSQLSITDLTADYVVTPANTTLQAPRLITTDSTEGKVSIEANTNTRKPSILQSNKKPSSGRLLELSKPLMLTINQDQSSDHWQLAPTELTLPGISISLAADGNLMQPNAAAEQHHSPSIVLIST